MKQVLILFLCILFTNILKAQCNAKFKASMNGTEVTFSTIDSNSSNTDLWFFGDHSYTSEGNFTSLPFVQHNYSDSGSYIVIHYVHNPINHCFDSSIQLITIKDSIISTDSTEYCNAKISYYRNGELDSKNFTFYSESITTYGINSYKWTVDGIVQSTDSYFSTNVSPDSNHSICLYITTERGCSSSDCKNIFIKDTLKCNKNLSFSAVPISSDKKTVQFFSNHDSTNQLKYLWNFGDWRSQLTEKNPTYTYLNGGDYFVKLTVYDSITNCYDTTVQKIHIFNPCDTFSATFQYSTLTDGTIFLTAISNEALTNTFWTIHSLTHGDSTANNYFDTSLFNMSNLTYKFSDSGYKYIQLSAQNSFGCWKEYIDTIYINKTLNRPSGLLKAFPNPATGDLININVDLESADKILYQVSNLNGNVIYKGNQQGIIGENTIKIPIAQFNKGQYYVQILFGDTIRNSSFLKL